MGFEIVALPGKTWAYCLEYKPKIHIPLVQERIWSALPENRAILEDEVMGGVLYVLALDTARAY
jgi:hypothetical protein